MPPEAVIRSRQNPTYKALRSLQRRGKRHQERAFLVEGPRYIWDAIRFGFSPVLIAVAEGHAEQPWIPNSVAETVRVLDDALFASISDTATSQGVIAVFPFPEIESDNRQTPFVLVADGIQDPGNLGTLIRSAAGAGATSVIVLPGTADPWSPKTVRAAAGAHFLVAIETKSVEELQAGVPPDALVVAAAASAVTTYDEPDYTQPIFLAVGSEGHGLRAGVVSLASVLVSIPLTGAIESLNAAVAGSIMLFEASRQRRKVDE